MSDFFTFLQSHYPQLQQRDFSQKFAAINFDSFELLTLRSLLEKKYSHKIPDALWVRLQTLEDLSEYYKGFQGKLAKEEDGESIHKATSRRDYLINMPQMSTGGLSEQWLFKEIGDMHWRLLAAGLETDSHNIQDELGNRLYATFVRIRWESNSHLQTFSENEALTLKNKISRFGKSMFFSETIATGENKEITAQLATTFAQRQSTNKSLLKGEPRIPTDSPILELNNLPRFSEDYRSLRKNELRELNLGGENFSLKENCIFEHSYSLNPYADLNGVNLLYFAAYPMISDICERKYAQQEKILGESDWALASSTIAREIFYFANCDLNDKIIYSLNEFSKIGDDRFKIAATFRRASDNQVMAKIFTIKKLAEIGK